MADTDAAAEQIVQQLLGTSEGRMDPYPLYHQLRDLAPVHRSDSAGAWVLTRYDDCQAVLRDPRVVRGYTGFQDATRPGWRDRYAFVRMETSMLMLDGPAHTRLRRLVTRAFTPRTIERLRPRIEALVDRLVDPMAEAGGGDLMAELAFPFPVEVIAELLGVPLADCPPFRDRSMRLTAIFELDATDAQLDDADQAYLESDAYFDELIAHKRKEPGADLLSDLLAVEEGDDLVCAEGTDAAECYVIAEGEADVRLDGRRIATVGSDDVVGERGPLLGDPRSASVVAASHLITYAISRRRLSDVIDANPKAAQVMRQFVESRQP